MILSSLLHYTQSLQLLYFLGVLEGCQKIAYRIDCFYKRTLNSYEFFHQLQQQEIIMKINSGYQGKQASNHGNHSHPRDGVELIKSCLWGLKIKDNSELFSRIAEQEISGKSQWIILAIRESLAANSSHPSVSHFIYLFDYMLTLPKLSMTLQSYLVQFYCDLFKHLLSQRNYSALDELKIIRKYWLGRINYQLYLQIHDIVLKWFKVDIERIPQYAVNDLKTFYIERLAMSYSEVYSHLPQLKSFQANSTQQRVIYRVDKHANDQNHLRQGKNNHLSLKNEKQVEKVQQVKIEEKYRRNESSDCKSHQQMSLSQAQKVVSSQIDFDTLKRLRQESEETTVSLKYARKVRPTMEESLNSSTDKSFQSVPKNQEFSAKVKDQQKQQNKRQKAKWTPLARCKKVSKEFNFLICYVCLECDMKFELQEELRIHFKDHSQNTLRPSELIISKNDVMIKEQQSYKYLRICKICQQEMNVEYKNRHWIFFDCSKITVYGAQFIIHNKCCEQVVIPPEEAQQEDKQEAQKPKQ